MTEASEVRIPEPRFTREDASDACLRILGRRPDDIDDPAATQRKSVGAVVNGRRVFVSFRDSDARAALEAMVLDTLHQRGAPVPALLGTSGRWLIQESLGDVRLSRAFRGVTRREGVRLLDAALASLAEIHQIARSAGLAKQVYRIGDRPGWTDDLIATPQKIGAFLGVPPPPLETSGLRNRLAPGQPQFIKWDARPPNAMPRPDGTVAWFDWEHCGCRNPLDDVAWFLGDESIPDAPDIEEKLIGFDRSHKCNPHPCRFK